MYYTIYKVTNQINGKIYIGSHKTKNLDDGYMGSGKYLRRAIEKNGVENFSKEILFVFDNPEDMYAKEAELVNEEFLAEENTYNLKLGGCGGFDHLNNINYDNPTHTIEHMLYMSSRTDRAKNSEAISEGLLKYYETHPGRKTSGFTGKKHSQETKSKISLSISKRPKEQNSQYGTRWIHSLELQKSKKIKKTDSLPLGWLEGRKIKFNVDKET